MFINFDEIIVFKVKGVKIIFNILYLILVIKSIKGMKVWFFLEESGGGVNKI